MTCIAYKAGILAGDTQSQVDDVVKHLDEIKVAKRVGHLFGIAGDNMPPINEAIKWYFTKDRKPFKEHEFDLLVITPSASIHVYDNRGRCDNVQGTFYAIGSGRQFAIGAMECGATSEQAVQAAIKWCPTVGGKVIVRKL
jgi:ATP-dependent protease HslVU (ClpYQ) peptidase subunit